MTRARQQADELADLLTSGLTGRRLYAELCERFPAISRFDCFLGVAMALAILEADFVIAQGEIEAASAVRAHAA